MSYRNAFKESLRELDADREEAARIKAQRLQEVYEKIPRVREIDEILSQTGLSLSKKILAREKDIGADKLISAAERENAKLQREKSALLKENGYKPNYLTDVYKCKLCGDTGFIRNEKCRCLKQRLISRYYNLSNLSDILKKENFDHFDLRYYSEERDPQNGISPRANIQNIYQVCQEFVTQFEAKATNLLFYGGTGLGKTFLCNCIAKDLLDNGKTVLYVTAPQLFKVFEEYRFNRDDNSNAEESIEMVSQADLIIIDDLGTEFPSVISASELFNIVNTRILNKKHMVISTNMNPNDFEAVYSDRIRSRLIGDFIMLKFFGQDIRFIRKYAKKK